MRWHFALLLLGAFATPALAAEGDGARGRQAFRACAACHSLEPDRNMTGPSLAGLWGRTAGSLPSFYRYSPALRQSGIVWNDASLDRWLADPAGMVPENRMTFPGINDDQARADLIAFLRLASETGGVDTSSADTAMGAMMGGGAVPNLRRAEPAQRVRSITHCRDTYRVVTADGTVHEFWERNLRFKTDSSSDGPEKDAPAIVGAGMMGDRASVIFAAPEEIGTWIKPVCLNP